MTGNQGPKRPTMRGRWPPRPSTPGRPGAEAHPAQEEPDSAREPADSGGGTAEGRRAPMRWPLRPCPGPARHRRRSKRAARVPGPGLAPFRQDPDASGEGIVAPPLTLLEGLEQGRRAKEGARIEGIVLGDVLPDGGDVPVDVRHAGYVIEVDIGVASRSGGRRPGRSRPRRSSGVPVRREGPDRRCGRT